MAEAGERSSLGTMVECDICFELMTKPKALTCLHHFCNTCTNKLMKENEDGIRGVDCPTCRKFTPEIAIQDSFMMNNLLEMYHKRQKSVSTKETHTIGDIVDEKEKEMFDINKYCPKHTMLIIDYNCKKCEKAGCAKCMLSEHNGHVTESIEEALESLVPKARVHLNTIVQKKEEIKESVDVIIDLLAECQANTEKSKKNISDLATLMINKVMADSKKLQEIIDITAEEKMKELNLIKFDLQNQMAIKESLISWTHNVVNMTRGPGTLCELQGGLYQQIEDCSTESRNDHINIEVKIPCFTPKYLSRDSCNVLGEVKYEEKKVMLGNTKEAVKGNTKEAVKADKVAMGNIKEIVMSNTKEVDVRPKQIISKPSVKVAGKSAKHLTTGEHIPRNYVVKYDNNLESQDWWFSMDKEEADKQLLLPSNPIGAFLVRASSDKKDYALSIRDQVKNQVVIKNYRIQGCYISPKHTFSSIIELIGHYKASSDGLCCNLTKACLPIPFKEMEVERQQIKLLKKLGAEQFGEVWAGKWRSIDVAVKTPKPGEITADEFLEEAKIMYILQHRKLVKLMGICTTSEPIYIITEFMVNGALLDYLRKDEGKTIRLKDHINMAAQIADGMTYLEEKNYIHRDLRAANILVGKNNVCKVANFEMAKLIASTGAGGEKDENFYLADEGTKLPLKWTAPEAASDRKFSIKSDVWSYGILLYELVTFGRMPYPGMTGNEVLSRIERGYRLPKPSKDRFECPDSLYEIMLKCWDSNPDNRYNFCALYDFFDCYSTEPSHMSIN